MHADPTLRLELAVQRYFDLMYDCDLSRFDEVFHATAQLHGVVDGQLIVWPASTYHDVLAKRAPPCSAHAPRQQEVLLVDRVGEQQALVKVRVRTAKTFHLEQTVAAA